ncbi:MAG TPA: AraC family transcriptional regulator [Mobilitalea sp.]|nr:AraC family transcriptional regulator [Mobilitalea sp.]
MNQICYVEYDASHPGEFTVDVPDTHDWWLMILTHTPAKFLIKNSMIEYPAGCIVLYPPKFRILYQGCSSSYTNDWLRFYTTEVYITNSTLPAGIPIPLPNPYFCHKLFQLLANENYFNNNFRDQSIDHLFRLLFHKLTEAYSHENIQTQLQELHNLRLEIKNNPGFPWSVTTMANRLHLSNGHLQAIYRKTFHIPCMEDVINHRILLAKEHLAQSTYALAEIAVLCGYNNVEHFCRQFRKVTGQTPKNYRGEYSTLKSLKSMNSCDADYI